MQRLRSCMAERPERAGTLILCEHPPTITCGKHSKSGNVLMSPEERSRQGVELVAIERGGDVTYHGPGQLMVYPVVRIGIRITAFLEDVAAALGLVAAQCGVAGAAWDSKEAGLWLHGRKLAACGLSVKGGISIHGFALNISTPPEAWRAIVPIGLAGPGPISLEEAARRPVPTVAEVAALALPELQRALASYGLDPHARADLP